MSNDAALLQRIDFFRLALNLGGNKETIKEMLLLFLTTTANQLEKLEAAERDHGNQTRRRPVRLPTSGKRLLQISTGS